MKYLTIIIFILFLAGPLAWRNVEPNVYEGGRSRNVRDRALRNSSAAAVILGEIRASTSDLLFIKTERYLDQGIAYEPHVNLENLSVSAETNEIDRYEKHVAQHQAEGGEHAHEDDHALEDEHVHEDEHEHGHEGKVAQTIIRTRDRDFRGFIGDLHRRVKPWRDPSSPHQHTGGTELLPWYRMMTLADPTNARAYSIGSWWLKQQNPDEAMKFIEEGLRHNPEAYQLYYAMGTLIQGQASKKRDALPDRNQVPEEIKNLFLQAGKYYRKGAELGLQQRPPGWKEEDQETDDSWTYYMDEDLRASARFAVIIEREFGDKERALELARDYSKRLDGDGILERQIEKLE